MLGVLKKPIDLKPPTDCPPEKADWKDKGDDNGGKKYGHKNDDDNDSKKYGRKDDDDNDSKKYGRKDDDDNDSKKYGRKDDDDNGGMKDDGGGKKYAKKEDDDCDEKGRDKEPVCKREEEESCKQPCAEDQGELQAALTSLPASAVVDYAIEHLDSGAPFDTANFDMDTYDGLAA